MFNYTQFTNDLIKAMTHKYVRRIPKGVTKTGKTKYVYYYAGQGPQEKKSAANEIVNHVNDLLVNTQARGDKNHFEHLVDSLKKVSGDLDKVNAGNINKEALKNAVIHIIPDARAAALNRLNMSPATIGGIRSRINVDALVNNVMQGKIKNDLVSMLKEQIKQKESTDVIEAKTLDYMRNRVQEIIKRVSSTPDQETQTNKIDQAYQRALDQTANPDHVDTVMTVLSRLNTDTGNVNTTDISNTMLSNIVKQIVPDVKRGLVNRFRRELSQKQIDAANIKSKDLAQKVLSNNDTMNKIKDALVAGVKDDKNADNVQYEIFQHIANDSQKHITDLLKR
jgi:hypothetical protein